MTRSFDLFDTLVGRLHFFPQSTFEQVEQHFPFPGFTFYRLAAQAKSNHTLADIYRHLRQMLDLTKVQTKTLMNFEFQTDLNQIFPIHETLSQVEDGDLIVSDTYYSRSQIKQILKKIGLKKKVRLYATAAGKYMGTVWDIIQKKYVLSSHLGDSLHSDVEMAKAKKIPGVHYTGSQPSAIEKALMDFGQSDLGCLMRALRLQNPYPAEMPEHLLWKEQTQLNIPLLIQSSLYLDAFCKEKKKKRVLFTSRDGCLWIQIFRTLFPRYESIYFHSSRFTYFFPTPTFIEYVKSTYDDDSVIVDSNGTGKSCLVFFKEHLKTVPIYFSIVNSRNENHCIFRKEDPCEGIEKLNYDLSGSLYDVQGGKPCRSSPEYQLRFIYPAHACIAKCCELLPHFRFESFNLQIMDWLIKDMDRELEIDKHVQHARTHAHFNDGDQKCIHVLNTGHLFETW